MFAVLYIPKHTKINYRYKMCVLNGLGFSMVNDQK